MIECLLYVMTYVRLVFPMKLKNRLQKMFPPPCPECGHYSNAGDIFNPDCECCEMAYQLEEMRDAGIVSRHTL